MPANLEVQSSRTAPPLIYVKKLHAGAHKTSVAITLTLQMIIRAITPATAALGYNQTSQLCAAKKSCSSYPPNPLMPCTFNVSLQIGTTNQEEESNS